MARSFAGIATETYNGTYYQKRARIQNQVAQVVPLVFNWNVYWQQAGNPSNVGVNVNLQQGLGNVPAISTLTSLYIDNTASANPVYVYFPDTGDTLTAQPYSAGWYLALTNQYTFTVFIEGLTAGQIPTTTILCTDVFVIPNVEYEVSQTQQLLKASPVIQQGQTFFNQNYAVPAIGDQASVFFTNLGNNGPFNLTVFNAQPSGFFYVTSILAMISLTPLAAVSQSSGISFENASATIVKWAFAWAFNASAGTVNPYTWQYPMGGMNVKLDATQQWNLAVGGASAQVAGFFSFNICYTYNPLNP